MRNENIAFANPSWLIGLRLASLGLCRKPCRELAEFEKFPTQSLGMRPVYGPDH